MNKPLHEGRARQAWPLLVSRARTKKPYTYGDLSAILGTHPRVAGYFLGVIQDYCDKHHLPPLQALAVRADTGLPGPGYRGSVRTLADHQKALNDVSKKSWPTKAPF